MRSLFQGYSKPFIYYANQGQSIASGVVTYAGLFGTAGFDTTEANRNNYVYEAFDLSKLSVYCRTFSLDVQMVVTVRKNGSDTGLAATITAADTVFTSNFNVHFDVGDYTSVKYDATGNTGGAAQTHSLTLVGFN